MFFITLWIEFFKQNGWQIINNNSTLLLKQKATPSYVINKCDGHLKSSL